jgi:hypothetical protein
MLEGGGLSVAPREGSVHLHPAVLGAVSVAALASGLAQAQGVAPATFPADGEFIPVSHSGVVADPLADSTTNEKNIVGDDGPPNDLAGGTAGAADPTVLAVTKDGFLFLRLRVDQSLGTDSNISANVGYGFAFDLVPEADPALATFENLFFVSGNDDKLEWLRNTVVTNPGDSREVAELLLSNASCPPASVNCP